MRSRPFRIHRSFVHTLAACALVVCAASAISFGQAIDWKSYSPQAFQRALTEDKPVLLVLEVPWNEAVFRADQELWTDPELRKIVGENFVAIRERADVRLDLARRYPAQGWPAISVLLPNGLPMYFVSEKQEEPRRITSGYAPPEVLRGVLSDAAAYFKANRANVVAAAQKREREIIVSARPTSGPTADATVWAVAYELEAQFDPNRRYFGGAPRIPRFDLIEMMYLMSGEMPEPWGVVGSAALETLVTNLVDEEGGMQRMALGLDWENPQPEKVLDRQGRMLEVLALDYRQGAQKFKKERIQKIAKFTMTRLGNSDGSFAQAVCTSCPKGRDEMVISESNAIAAAGLMRAGAAINDAGMIDRGLAGAYFLKDKRYKAGRGVPRAVIAGNAVPAGNLTLDDQAATAWAFVTAYEVTGETVWLDAAKDIARSVLANLRDDGPLADLIAQPRGPVPLARKLFPLQPNALMTRVFVRLFYLTDDRTYRLAARDVLKSFAGSYKNASIHVPAFGVAAYEYHFPPMSSHVVARGKTPAARSLRLSSMGGPHPYTVVRSWDVETDAQTIKDIGFTIQPKAQAYVFLSGMSTVPVSEAGTVKATMQDLREKVRRRDDAKKKLDERKKKEAAKPEASGGGGA